MPFTFSHPAIVLPLTYLSKKRYSLTGLVIGSLTPDFEYFLRMSVKSTYSHTFYGLFWFDLPLGLLLAFAFHAIVRDSLLDHLPMFFKSRFLVFKQFKWNEFFYKNWLVVVVSILVGALSHIFWDSFTHEQGYFVKINPSLTNTITIFKHPVAFFKIIQHTSSVLGALTIAIAVYKMPNFTIEIKSKNYRYWLSIVILTFIIIGIRLLFGLNINQYGNVIVSIISAFLLALLLIPLLFAITKYKA